MKEFKGTPGPWFAEYSKANNAYEIAPMRPSGKCMDWEREVCITANESAENANLIAAAPELLEALQQCIPHIRERTKNDGHAFGTLQLVNRILAKALGETK